MSTLHDRITALTFASDDGTEYEHDHGPYDGHPSCPACWAATLRAVLAETATTQPDTLHDRIAALADEYERRAEADPYDSTDYDHAARALRAVLAESTTAQPEADAVERAARAIAAFDRTQGGEPIQWEAWPEKVRDWWRDQARAALAAAQPVEPEPDEREAREARPEGATGCDACGAPSTRIISGGFRFCDDHGPKR